MASSATSMCHMSPLTQFSAHRSAVAEPADVCSSVISSHSVGFNRSESISYIYVRNGLSGGISELYSQGMRRRGPHRLGIETCATSEDSANTSATENTGKSTVPSTPIETSAKPSPFSTATKKIGGASGKTKTPGPSRTAAGSPGPTGSAGSAVSKPAPYASARGEKSREAEKKLLASGSMRPTTSFGSKKLLDAFKEGDKFDSNVKVGQPKAPANIFTDVVRTAEEIEADKWQFRLDRGQVILVLSFFASSLLMFATVWLVWKVGAIHFNEY